MNKTSMSVREMGNMLGLCKTESYWLVKKKVFEVREVAGTMRVMIESFEDWYAGQLHYKKLNGELPGSKLAESTLSIAEVAKRMNLFGDEFTDYNLVFCNVNGRPIEGSVINRAFCELIEKNGLPRVVFHSLRHSSITYKLKLNGGDIKSVHPVWHHAVSTYRKRRGKYKKYREIIPEIADFT